MPHSTTAYTEASPDHAIWDSLKQAIARSSGFKRWYVNHCEILALENLSVDQQVTIYLKETLETLAY
ncbi:hypothetical protein AWQ21_12595 [Picosynechococcus sp. PCC 7003]|uniref:hypothetical protein n=1 Tax=Picosynechococcus sp. PCC 7003 TaxID=374981 RepID=UPI0008103A95|nr:hypothetical protein [Picosynechococcus sp. PCC 7003]ANV85142.1 hypothetical protein AWQ21_12595 [Picosynechococcus sp. PCC 7003]